MPAADDFHDLGGGLFAWSAYSPAAKVELSAHALVLPGPGSAAGMEADASRILVFVDPIALRPAALEELLRVAAATPAAVLITNGNHARAADDFRRRLRVPVLAAAEARAALREDGLEIDGEIPAAGASGGQGTGKGENRGAVGDGGDRGAVGDGGDRVAGASPVSPAFPDAPPLFANGGGRLRAIALPGFAAGETAFFYSAAGGGDGGKDGGGSGGSGVGDGDAGGFGGTLLVGDALIHLEPPYDFVPLPKKYCTAPKETPAALRRLLDLPRFERMTFAHGTPLLVGARARLAALLAAGGGQAS